MAQLGIIHGVVAQTFFILMCAIALFTSRFWIELARRRQKIARRARGLRTLVLADDAFDFLPA